MKIIPITKDFLQLNYSTLGNSTEQIGILIGCSGRTIRNNLRKHGIPFNEQMKANSLKALRDFGYDRTGIPPTTKGHTKYTHPGLAKAAKEKTGKKRANISGKLHHNWKNGATKEAQKIRNSAEYKSWRKTVYERDDYTCHDCGIRGGRLVVHHIKPFANNPELRLSVNNGMTLCRPCHSARHLGHPALKDKPKSEEHRRKISEANKGKHSKPKGPMSDETKAKLSTAMKGRRAWNAGLTKDTALGIARMAEINRKRMTGKTGRNSPVWSRWHPGDS